MATQRSVAERERRARAVVAVTVLATFALGVVAAGLWALGELKRPVPKASSSPRVSYATPEETVRAYYDAVARHNRSGLLLLTASKRAAYGDTPDSDFVNVVSLTRMVVKPAKIKGSTASVTVTFTARYRHLVTSPSGPQTRVVTLDQNGASHSWQILSIGMGP